MLKHSDNILSRRQEVGRGLRLSVDQHGERMDLPAVVHDINVLTVVSSESYKDFVSGLQTEIAEALSAKHGSVKHIYFVVETKGSMSSMKLREIEKTKIECARKLFAELNEQITAEKVKYGVVTDYAKLIDLVNEVAA